MTNLKNIIDRLKSSLSILKDTLNLYGSYEENKNRNCVHCNSSDALKIKAENNTYKCFSCGTGGSVIDLVMNKENTDFMGAVKILCANNGIELPKAEYTEEEKELFEKYLEDKKELNKYIFKLECELKNPNINIDTKFRISCLIDRIKESNEFIKESEIINHSQYKPSNIYMIDKYISEDIEGLKLAIDSANSGGKVLVLAPTGSGKTDTTIKYFRDINKLDSCFISPNASNVEQIINKYNIPGAFGEISAEETFAKNNIKSFTWDKFAGLKNIDLSNTIAIVDEIHQTFNDMYRNEKIKGLYANLNKCKGQIDITATPNKLDLNSYDLIIEYKQKEQTKYNVHLYNNKNDTKVLEIINKSKKFALLENNTKHLEYYGASTSKKTDIVTRSFVDTNKSKTYDDIMVNSSIGDYEGILNTSIIIAGVNIYDKDITDIIIIDEKDISTLKQYCARFRDLKEVNVHIFNKYEDESKFYSLEYLVNKKIDETQQALNGINYFNKQQLQKSSIYLRPMKLEEGNNFYYDANLGEYKIDIPSIRNEVYSQYYRKADIFSFKELIEEYFTDNISIIEINEDNSQAKSTFKKILKIDEEEARNILGNYLDILVGANEILKGKISTKLFAYIMINGLSKEYLLEQLNKYNIKDLVSIGSNKKLIDLYTKYVLENNFTYEFAWHMCNLGNAKRGKVFSQLNKIIFRKIEQNYPQLINKDLVENKLHNLIIQEFRPGTSYTQEHLELFIKTFKNEVPILKLSVKHLGSIINDNYNVDVNRHKFSMLPQLENYFYKNIVPNHGNEEKDKQIRVYTIKDFKNINDIVLENNLSEESKKSLSSIIDRRFKNIIDSKEAKEILEVNKIFSSK